MSLDLLETANLLETVGILLIPNINKWQCKWNRRVISLPEADAKAQVDLQTGWCLNSAVQRSSEVIP